MREELLDGKLAALRVVEETADGGPPHGRAARGVARGSREPPALPRHAARRQRSDLSAGVRSRRPGRTCARTVRLPELAPGAGGGGAFGGPAQARRDQGSTSTRPAGSARLAWTASSIASSGEHLAEQGRQLEPAGGDVLEQDRQRDGRILRAVHRPGQELLAPQELAGIEVEPQPGRRQSHHHRRAAAAREAERRRARLGIAHRIEAVVGALRGDRRRSPPSGRRDARRAWRRAEAPAHGAPSTGSTTTIASAPAIRAPWTTNWPTPPRADHERDPAGLGTRREQHRADPGQRGAAEERRLAERHGAARRQRDLRRDHDPLGPGAGGRAAVDGLAVERHARSFRRRASRCRSRGGAARRRRAGRVRSRRNGRTTAPTRARPRHRRGPSRPRRRRTRRCRLPRARAPSASAAATRPSPGGDRCRRSRPPPCGRRHRAGRALRDRARRPRAARRPP